MQLYGEIHGVLQCISPAVTINYRFGAFLLPLLTIDRYFVEL
jgi:hypothetical protein